MKSEIQPVEISGYREFFNSLNRFDRQRVLYMQWDLIGEGFGKGLEFPALLCWHEAIDRAKEYGLRPRRDPDDETPTRVAGKIFASIDSDIQRNHEGGPEEPSKQPAKKRRRRTPRKPTSFSHLDDF